MLFTPKYTVSYHGVIHLRDIPFEIDADDAEEMRKHGVVYMPDEVAEPEDEVSETKPEEESGEETPKKKPGRPKKAE